MRYLAIALCLGFMACSSVAKEELPTISTGDLAAGIAAKSLMVIDNNTPEIFAKNHIPTAVHMDPRNPDLKLFPTDKDAKLVFYCKNTWCMASHAGARHALKAGYKNAHVYPDGIDGWIKAGQRVESNP